jgi:hypothetical protein
MKYLSYKTASFLRRGINILRKESLWKLSLRILISTLKKTWKKVE